MPQLIGFIAVVALIIFVVGWIWENILEPVINFFANYGLMMIGGAVAIFVLVWLFKMLSGRSQKKAEELEDAIRVFKSMSIHKDLEKFESILSVNMKKIIFATQREYKDKWANYLCRAAYENNIGLVKKLISNGLNASMKDSDGNNALMSALSSSEDNNELVKYLISKKANLEDINNNSETPLLIAARVGNAQNVKLLISKKANQTVTNSEGYTPLLVAVLYDKKDIIELLLQKGSDIETKANDGSTALIIAANKGYEETVELLLEKNANIEATENENNLTPLLEAVTYEHDNVVNILLEKGSNIEATTNDGQTSLHIAAVYGFKNLVETLLEKGAEIEAKSDSLYTPLHLAAAEGYTDIVNILLEKGSNIESIDDKDFTPLHLASMMGHKETVSLLLKHGANIEASCDGLTPILLASTEKKHEVVELLIEEGAKFDITNSKVCELVTGNLFDTAYETIFNAIIGNNIEAVKLFLDQGSSIEIKDDDGDTPLLLAVSEGHLNIVRLLLDKGAYIEAKDNDGSTPLICSANAGYLSISKLLLENKGNIEAKDNGGFTPLICACGGGHKDVVELLINKGANIEVTEPENAATPLMIASIEGYDSIVSLLLKNGANIESQTNENVTALHFASSKGQANVVKVLLENNANIEVTETDGSTPLILASENDEKKVVSLLIEAGAKFDVLNESICYKVTKNLFEDGYKVIIDAIKDNNYKAVKLFLDQGFPTSEEIGGGLLSLAVDREYIDIVELLVENGVDVVNYGQPAFIRASSKDSVDSVNILIEADIDINYINEEGINALSAAAFYGSKNVLELLLKNNNIQNPLFNKVVNEIELTGYDSIKLNIQELKMTQLGATLYYKTDYDQHFDWVQKSGEVQKILGLKHIELIDDHSGQYVIKVYNDSDESKLIRSLTVNGKKPQFVEFIERDYTSYIFFKSIAGLSMEHWNEQKSFIEHELKLPVDIEIYDSTHRLYPEFGEENLIVIIESNISVMPDALEIGGKYLKTEIENGYQTYYFENVEDISIWHDKKEEIISFIHKRVNIEQDGLHIKLIESVEESIPKLLGLVDSNKNTPILHAVKEEGENKIYFYTFLPELDLNEWKEKSKKTNFRTLFNEPDKVYKLDIYDKTNDSLYDEEFYKGQLIVLKELARIPSKEDLQDKNALEELKSDNIFWGYGAGSHRYYSDLSLLSHLMIIGASGSGKSNFINGIVLSLLNSIESVKKLYLIDLKSGIEFNRYNDLESDKITVFSRGTKPSKLLEALYEVEAEMYLREEYMAANNIIKMDKDPIFVVIDEFAQINLMHARGDEMQAKDEIFDTLIRLGTRARSANIKLIVQTQDPKSVGEDLKVHLMSRVLLKTGKDLDREFTLQNPDMMDELGIKHTKFDKGRFVFEDYNEGDTLFTELQFPFINPDKKYHMNFKDNAQSHTEMDESIYDSYKEYISSEYDYLANTKLLSGNKVTNISKKEVMEENDNIVDVVLNEDEFDFDSLLDDTPVEDANSNDDMMEINNMFSDAKDLLKELKEGK